MTYNYPPNNIWNCDKYEVQIGRNEGGLVWALRGSKTIHSFMPNESEWITTLSWINANGHNIPKGYLIMAFLEAKGS